MNQKGIVLSSLVYALLVFFFLLLIALLMMLRYRQMAINNLADDANDIYDNANMLGYSKAFNYTGTYQSFTAQLTGDYKIELWGAQGGSEDLYNNTSNGGKGSYTSGIIKLNAGTTLYFYVGGAGTTVTTPGSYVGYVATVGTYYSIPGGYNGGGDGIDEADGTALIGNETGAPGGGATDVRLTPGVWDNATSLNSRIMVAAGGSGAFNVNGVAYPGSIGGGLTSYHNVSGFNATQTSGYLFGVGQPGTYVSDCGDWGTSGAGGGYYGGKFYKINTCPTSWGDEAIAAGGSSFVSGYTGCDAIDSTGNHTGQPNHFSGYVFTDGVMINGATSMPTPGGGMEVGHSGNGYAIITNIP